MNRRTLPAAAALAAAATLLLTACGDGGSTTDGKITGAESSAPSSSSPPPTTPPQAGRPTVTLPADFKNVFEGWTTGDAVKDAALTDLSGQINAVDAAIASGEAEAPAVVFYNKGMALVNAGTWIAKMKTEGYVPTGTARYFNPRIQMFDDKSAGVAYCSDESKEFAKDRSTGKVHTTPVTANSYVAYNVRLEKNEQGVWQTTQLNSTRGDKSCTP
ncbi:hypothetical protein [Streptomyces sp. NPDC091268]|uniref:hypothetical protein n=1 Tax=Streptomyces sp. NPDC091268 TaxID=3365979 RepID=UPI003823B4E0